MSAIIKTPSNQQRHTNIAIVKSKTKPKFELACYKNKVIDFRNGIEKDLSKVIQIDEIFAKVSEGTVAKTQDLLKVFGTTEKQKIVVEILNHGELQISEKERVQMFESMKRDIINYVVNLCLNPSSKKPYTAGLIEREMKNIHFAVHPNKSTKVQALSVIRKLAKVIPIVRARMRLKIVVDPRKEGKLKRWLSEVENNEECTLERSISDTSGIVFFVLIDPGLFRKVEELAMTALGGVVEVLDPCVQDVKDTSIEEYTVQEGSNNHKQPETRDKEHSDDSDSDSKKKSKSSKSRKPSKSEKFEKSAKSIESEEEGEESVITSTRPKKTKKKKEKKLVTTRKPEKEDEEEEDPLVTSTQPKKAKKKSKKEAAPVDDLYMW